LPPSWGQRASACTRSRPGPSRPAPPRASRTSTNYSTRRPRAPARRLVTIEDVGLATAGLATDAAKLITGDTIYIDGGYHIMG
jgi:NAD(P)-dependent dehydrogenase (short-subunit alcohol dehydrogenase family)